MKNINEFKDEVAKKYGYESWAKVDWYQLDAMNETKPYEQDSQDHLLNEAIEMMINEERAKSEETIAALGMEVRELQDSIITNNNTIDQLVREADYQRMDYEELKKKYDGLVVYFKERYTESDVAKIVNYISQDPENPFPPISGINC
jgi:hypothetical protein